MENCHCYLVEGNKKIKICNGYVYPGNGKRPEKIEFFYMYSGSEMIHKPFEKAISDINAKIKHLQRASNKRRRKLEHVGDFQKISDSETDVELLVSEKKTEKADSSPKETPLNVVDSSFLADNVEKFKGSGIPFNIDEERRELIKKWLLKKGYFSHVDDRKQFVNTSENNVVLHNWLYLLNPVVDLSDMWFSLEEYENVRNSFSQKYFLNSLGLTATPSTNLKKSKNISNRMEVENSNRIEKKNSTVNFNAGTSNSKKNSNPKIEIRNSNSNPKNIRRSYITRSYDPAEDRAIINHILTNGNFDKVNGNAVWKDLEMKDIMPNGGRSWQSLRNRYIKYIVSNLKDYGLTSVEEIKLQKGWRKGTIKKREVSAPNYGLVISKKSKLNKIVSNKENCHRTPKKISPERITHKNMSILKKTPNNLSKYNFFSDSQGNTVQKSLIVFKSEDKKNKSSNFEKISNGFTKRQLFSNKSFYQISSEEN